MGNSRNSKQKRRRKNRMHNVRAVFLWVLLLTVIVLLGFGIFEVVKRLRASDGESAKPETISQNEAALTEEEEKGNDSEAEASETEESETEEESEEESEEEFDEEDKPIEGVRLVMVGDMMMHDNVEKYSVVDGRYSYDNFFEHIREDLIAADIAMVSEEVVIAGSDIGVMGYPAFNAPFGLADDLVEAGFNVILHASNHIFDLGERGVETCLQNWRNRYPNTTILGIHESQEAQDQIYVYEKDGIRIAILNYTYGVNSPSLGEENSFRVDLLEEQRVRSDIQKAKQQADFVVVCPHWGTEYETKTDAMQQAWTELFLEEGVDLVIGSHPHVIQPIKMLKNDTTGKEMLVYYSLGNFVNWTSEEGNGVMNRFVGGMADVTIGRNADGEVAILDYGVTGLVCHVTSKEGGITVYKISDYTQDLATENELRKQDNMFSLEYASRLCDRIWGSHWK